MKIYLHRIAITICLSAIAFTSESVAQDKTESKQSPTINETAETVANDKPLFDFPATKPDASPDQFVLCPSRQFYDSAVEKGVDKTTFIYYAATMIEVGNELSKVKNLASREFSLPNQLIITIPKNQTAKVGDVLLTWWQTGSGLQRAIVVGGTESEPIVRYLDITLDNPSGAGKKTDTLKPNSFYVLDRPWQIGSTVSVNAGRTQRHGLILALNDDRVMVQEFAGKLKCYDREKANPVPIVPNLKANDAAQANLYGSFKPVTVVKVDAAIGRVFATFQLGRKEREIAFAFGDILAEKK